MKVQEIRSWSDDEIGKKVDAWEEELFNLRFQTRLGQLANPVRLQTVRRDIARAKTVLRQRKSEVTADKK